MSDSTDSSAEQKPAPSGSGEKHADVSINLDPQAIENLVESHPSTDADAKTASKSGTATHQLSIDVSGMTWGEVKDKFGTTTFVPEVKASLTPASSTNELQADVHANLIEQNWGQIDGIGLKTVLGGDLKYNDDKLGGDVTVEQDVTFKSATLSATVTTDFATGAVSATAGFKFSF
jgi:hypothetical protein